MANRYLRGQYSNITSTSSWSATDGGPTGASVPTSADDVFVTNLTGLTANYQGMFAPSMNTLLNCKSFTVTQTTYKFNIDYSGYWDDGDNWNSYVIINSYGDVTFNSQVNAGTNDCRIQFSGSGSMNFTSSGVGMAGITVAGGGTLNLLDNVTGYILADSVWVILISKGIINFGSGTHVLGELRTLNTVAGQTIGVNLGSSNITTYGTWFLNYSYYASGCSSFVGGTSTVTVKIPNGNIGYQPSIYGTNISFNNFIIDSSVSTMAFLNDAASSVPTFSFNNFTFHAGQTIGTWGGGTYTFANPPTQIGTSPMSYIWQQQGTGANTIWSCPSTITLNNVDVRRNTASGAGIPFHALSGSTIDGYSVNWDTSAGTTSPHLLSLMGCGT